MLVGEFQHAAQYRELTGNGSIADALPLPAEGILLRVPAADRREAPALKVAVQMGEPIARFGRIPLARDLVVLLERLRRVVLAHAARFGSTGAPDSARCTRSRRMLRARRSSFRQVLS